MIPFENTWPYDIIQGDVYVSDCPFCSETNVLLPMKPEELVAIREGRKKRLVFPCCYSTATVVDTDRDYLLADKPLRRK
jgi:hypothetical protein